LSQRGALIGHPMPLSFFRQHANSQSNPASNRYFIYSVTYYEEVLELAMARGILTAAEQPVAYQNLLNHYAYWVASFPELNDRISRIHSRLAA
jgi:hypothetical protein